MEKAPQTRYAKSGSVHIAYQVVKGVPGEWRLYAVAGKGQVLRCPHDGPLSP